MIYSTELALHDKIHFRSFMKIGTGVQAILRFCINNFKCCNVGINDLKEL
jgi:hypothetical protein